MEPTYFANKVQSYRIPCLKSHQHFAFYILKNVISKPLMTLSHILVPTII